MRPHRRSTESTLGEGQGAADGCKGSKARQTNDVSFGSSQNRSRAAG